MKDMRCLKIAKRCYIKGVQSVRQLRGFNFAALNLRTGQPRVTAVGLVTAYTYRRAAEFNWNTYRQGISEECSGFDVLPRKSTL